MFALLVFVLASFMFCVRASLLDCLLVFAAVCMLWVRVLFASVAVVLLIERFAGLFLCAIVVHVYFCVMLLYVLASCVVVVYAVGCLPL